MPFVMKGDAQGGSSTSGTQATTLVGKDTGGKNLTVVNAGIDPGAGLALHIHPDYEEATLVVEGNIEAVLEGETRTLGPGDLLLAPVPTAYESRNIASYQASLPDTTRGYAFPNSLPTAIRPSVLLRQSVARRFLGYHRWGLRILGMDSIPAYSRR